MIKSRGKTKSEIYIQDNMGNSCDLNIWSARMWNLTLRYQKFGYEDEEDLPNAIFLAFSMEAVQTLCYLYNIRKRWFKSNKYVRYFTWRTLPSWGNFSFEEARRFFSEKFIIQIISSREIQITVGQFCLELGSRLIDDAIYVMGSFSLSQLYVKLD